MASELEDLRILKIAEEIADEIWQQITGWNAFARDVVGKQLARAADSVGANIAESYGRFSYGEKLQFLYYARGSLFETKYWLNRVLARQLMDRQVVQSHSLKLTAMARQLNALAASVKRQRSNAQRPPSQVREEVPAYTIPSDAKGMDFTLDDEAPLFSVEELTFLESPSL